jgi:UDP-N-acetylglucosamine--N-acetylmuramyl-(pentapeptide) pyrophosphoryl-undecaprenol N-acetylglucosamine transferase
MTTKLPATARILFAGGGTGGHLFPAVAIADRITDLWQGRTGLDIQFVGTKRGIEYRIKDSLRYPITFINIRGLQRSFSLANLALPYIVVGALVSTWRLFSRFMPDIVVGTGGYVSWPVVRIAVARNVPAVLQEQNSFPGIVTRQMASRAEKIYLGFDGARNHLPQSSPALWTGNPVRPQLTKGARVEAMTQFNLDPSKKTVLVLGGSQGAHGVNSAVLTSLKNNSLTQDCQLLWQTGKRDFEEMRAESSKLLTRGSVFAFHDRMNLVYSAADIAVARAGASTIAELNACAVPSVLIPFPHATADHQNKNAQECVAQGCASLVSEASLSEIDIIRKACDMLHSGEAEAMRSAIAHLNRERRPAVDVIAEDILRIVAENQRARELR